MKRKCKMKIVIFYFELASKNSKIRVIYVPLTFELLFANSFQSDLSINFYVFSKSKTRKLHFNDSKTAGINTYILDNPYLNDKAILRTQSKEYAQ